MQFTMLKSVSTYLGVASSLLNRQLELLEQQVGGPLFIRYLSPTPQRPTARGQALLDALETATVQNQMVAASGGRDCLRLPGTDTAVQRRPYDGLSVRAISMRGSRTHVLRYLVNGGAKTVVYPGGVAQATGASKTTVYRVLREMAAAGWLSQRRESDRDLRLRRRSDPQA
ncbi:helix-turn-helix domain-containing protein [Nocardia tengchongensis]|uniref:helix-turn-helix domain-containing protein n=1 Tax=Nocardia tengchongensis TaxID=2055889 RepID=UPI00367EDB61